jgi:hypothetical protein
MLSFICLSQVCSCVALKGVPDFLKSKYVVFQNMIETFFSSIFVFLTTKFVFLFKNLFYCLYVLAYKVLIMS